MSASLPEQQIPSRIPQMGDEILYVLPTGRSAGQERFGHICRLFSSAMLAGRANLQVLTDNTNDFPLGQFGSSGLLWVTSAPYSTHGELGTWRFCRDPLSPQPARASRMGDTHPAAAQPPPSGHRPPPPSSTPPAASAGQVPTSEPPPHGHGRGHGEGEGEGGPHHGTFA